MIEQSSIVSSYIDRQVLYTGRAANSEQTLSSETLIYIPILMIFGMLNPEKIWHENLTGLSTSPVRCSYFSLGIQKSFSTVLFIHTSDYFCYLRRKQTVIHLPTPPENVTSLTSELKKVFHLTEGLLRSFKRWKLWREPVVGCRRSLWKEPVMMCGNWNARLAVSKQVFRVTTFCINTSFQFFSTPIVT